MTTTTQTITVTVALNGLPDCCPECGEQPKRGEWDLTTFANTLAVSCPACLMHVAPVRAVAAVDPDCE